MKFEFDSNNATELRAVEAAVAVLCAYKPVLTNWPTLDEQAAHHNGRAVDLHAQAESETDKAAACLTAHNAQGGVMDAGAVYRVGVSEHLAAAISTGNADVKQWPVPDADSTGAEWNADLHASTKTKNADGTWKKRRGAGKAEDAVAEGERIHESFANAVDVRAVEVQTPAMPPLPPAPTPTFPPLPPAAPLVTMNDIYALIQTGKCVLNDVIAGAQAKGFADVGAFSRDATPEQRAELLAELTKGE